MTAVATRPSARPSGTVRRTFERAVDPSFVSGTPAHRFYCFRWPALGLSTTLGRTSPGCWSGTYCRRGQLYQPVECMASSLTEAVEHVLAAALGTPLTLSQAVRVCAKARQARSLGGNTSAGSLAAPQADGARV